MTRPGGSTTPAVTAIAMAELRQGEKVLDLGSSGGIDVLLWARRVGETGFAYGVDLTDEIRLWAFIATSSASAYGSVPASGARHRAKDPYGLRTIPSNQAYIGVVCGILERTAVWNLSGSYQWSEPVASLAQRLWRSPSPPWQRSPRLEAA